MSPGKLFRDLALRDIRSLLGFESQVEFNLLVGDLFSFSPAVLELIFIPS